MDPVPLGLGLTLIAIILYLLSELSSTKRELEKANRDLDAYRQTFPIGRLEHSREHHLQLEAQRANLAGQAELATLGPATDTAR